MWTIQHMLHHSFSNNSRTWLSKQISQCSIATHTKCVPRVSCHRSNGVVVMSLKWEHHYSSLDKLASFRESSALSHTSLSLKSPTGVRVRHFLRTSLCFGVTLSGPSDFTSRLYPVQTQRGGKFRGGHETFRKNFPRPRTTIIAKIDLLTGGTLTKLAYGTIRAENRPRPK